MVEYQPVTAAVAGSSPPSPNVLPETYSSDFATRGIAACRVVLSSSCNLVWNEDFATIASLLRRAVLSGEENPRQPIRMRQA